MCSLERQNGFYSAMAGIGDKNGSPEFASAVRSKIVNEPSSSPSADPAPALAGRQAKRPGSTVLTSPRGGISAPSEKKTLLGQ